jgi:hypothetical protein
VAAAAVTAPDAANDTAQPSPEQMKRMADTQAEPLLAKLKADPGNPQLLANVGNVYYDAQQFPIAIELPASPQSEAGRLVGAHRHGDRVLVTWATPTRPSRNSTGRWPTNPTSRTRFSTWAWSSGGEK